MNRSAQNSAQRGISDQADDPEHGALDNFIELKNVTRVFKRGEKTNVNALSDISLAIHQGEFIAIMGPSGSGKSTLMNILGCLDVPTTGSYTFDGSDPLSHKPDELAYLRRTQFGFVFQEYNLIDSSTALDNVELPAIYSRINQSSRRARATALLNFVGLEKQTNQLSVSLSGGEQQRVAIARALMNGARVILADEPTGALDAENSEIILTVLRTLVDDGCTVVIITHDQEVAERTNRIVHLQQGRIVSDEILGTPSTESRSSTLSQIESDRRFATQQAAPTVHRRIIETLKMVVGLPLRDLLRFNRIRTFMAGLSMIVSMWSVTAFVSLLDANYQRTLSTMTAMGAGSILLTPSLRQETKSIAPVDFTVEDASVLAELEHVGYVLPLQRMSLIVRSGEKEAQADLWAIPPEFVTMEGRRLARGSSFSKADMDTAQRVAILGSDIVDELFPNWDTPVGRYVIIQEIPFLVKGVLRRFETSDQAVRDRRNERLYIPLTSAQEHLRGSNVVDQIRIFTTDAKRVDAIVASIDHVLMKRHGRRGYVLILDAVYEFAFTRVERMLTALTGFIGVISLIFGGFGVMSVMLISVQRRTREIGIRTSCGARRRDILNRFLVEASTITIACGSIGLMLGVVSVFVLAYLGFPIEVSGWAVWSALACTMFSGIVFGIVPARRAAKLDPVVALAR